MAIESPLPRPIYVYGYPRATSGAGTELWHTVKLWRSHGADVRLVTTGYVDPTWHERLTAIGAATTDLVPSGSVVVGFCNPALRKESARLRQFLGCKTVCVPCMAWLYAEEARELLYDRYVFQSDYQRDILMLRLSQLGLRPEHGPLIRGAFDVADLPYDFHHHTLGEPFVVGRLSRATDHTTGKPALDKFPADLWAQYEAILYRPLKARVMGWSAEIEKHCGPPPKWAEVLPAGTESPQKFLGSLHALVPGIGCCRENWPRVGLEAMAAGVPIVAENRGGWNEMLPTERADCRDSQARILGRWAKSDKLRQQTATYQRRRVELLADPEPIWAAWRGLFAKLMTTAKGLAA